MNNVTMRLLLALLLALALNQCSDKQPTKPTIDWRDTLTYVETPTGDYVETPTDDLEAETAAYFLSGTRLAPTYLFDKIQEELGFIRSQHDTVTGVSVGYWPSTLPSCLLLRFDSVVTESIRSGEYHSWDSLNDLCNLDTFSISYGYISMQFEGFQNPVALFDIYKSLPDLWHISTNGLMGDGPGLFLSKEGENIKYFFREAWGDCPAGCIYSRFSFFTVSDSMATFHGSYQPVYPSDSPGPHPSWYHAALQAMSDHHHYEQWSRDTLGG